MVLNKKDMYQYQNKAKDHIMNVHKCALWLDMGLGKTISTLTAIEELMFEEFEIKKTLIIAPLRVCNTVWEQEAKKWSHTSHLRFVNLAGGKSNMLKGLQRKGDVYLINRENVAALVLHTLNNKIRWPFDMVVIDESSSFKDASTKRFKALKKISHRIDRLVELTGTPAPNGYTDLWSQFYLIDGGLRLGRTQTLFRNRYFDKDFMGFKYTLREGAEEKIHKALSDVVISMKTEDYLELPESISIILENNLDKNLSDMYDDLERDMLLELSKTDTIVAMSAPVLSNKLLQFSSGNIYDGDRIVHRIHTLKIDTLKEIIENNPNENILVAYNFKHELSDILEHFPEAVALDKDPKTIEKWNRGDIKILVAHPASAGHGLNLQFGGRIAVWYGFNWSLELYQQFNKRLHRNGQTDVVKIMHIAVGDVEKRLMKTLADKDATQDKLIESLKG